MSPHREAQKRMTDIFEMPPDDPMPLFDAWLAEAGETEINDAEAVALATCRADGAPNVRMVLLKGHDARGFVFYSNRESDKGAELAGDGRAALCFHWKSCRKQVRVRGGVEAVSEAEADAYFATRGRASRIGAWASEQSRPLASRAVLEEAAADFAAKFEDSDVPRPPHWVGWRLVPLEIEFWQDGEARLHDRILYRRDAVDAAWRTQRLFP